MKARELFAQALWIVQGLDQGAARLPWDNGDTITADLLDFLNAAVLETATLRPDVTARTEAVLLSPGMRQHIPTRRYSRAGHDALTLMEVLRNMGHDGETPGPFIPLVEAYQLRCAPQTFGCIVQNYAYDRKASNDLYEVYPAVPEVADVWVELTYSARPATLTDPDDVLPVSEAYVGAIVQHMAAGLLSGDAAGAARAQAHMVQFHSLLGAA